MKLLLHDLTPWHWALGGLGVAGIVLLTLWMTGRRLGVSTGYESVCSLVVKTPYLRRPKLLKSNRWRLSFLVGLLLGGVVSAVLAGGVEPTWDLGLWDAFIGGGVGAKIAWMFVGGVLIGFGTRVAGGCTSGHAIFGISNLEWSGLRSTLAFMAAGFVTTNLIYRVLFS